MIFVTVGTHEQQFNRLIKEVDRLKGEGVIEDDVIMQTGYSTYEPRYCKWSKLIPYDEMNKNIEEAKMVITHGGPASFIAPLEKGKIPIVVPRQKQFDEHVNDHQLEFCRTVEKRFNNIIVVNDIDDLGTNIIEYSTICYVRKDTTESNNEVFNRQIEEIVKDIFKI